MIGLVTITQVFVLIYERQKPLFLPNLAKNSALKRLKKCIMKGYNWSVKGPTKNLYSYTGGGMPLGHTKFLRPHNL